MLLPPLALSFIPVPILAFALMLPFIFPLVFMLPFIFPLVVPFVLALLFQLAEFMPVVPFVEPFALELSFMVPFTFPEVFIEAEPEVPVVPVEPLALNELLPEVPVVPLTPVLLSLPEVELLVPVALSVLVGFTALFIPVVLFLDESKLRDP